MFITVVAAVFVLHPDLFLVNVATQRVECSRSASLLGVRALRDVARDEPGPLPDIVGAMLLITSIAALFRGVVNGHSWGWTNGRIVGASAVFLPSRPAGMAVAGDAG
jgi:hypothetical protein